jgi:DNA topoisomerase-1
MNRFYIIENNKIIPEPSDTEMIRISNLKIPPNWKNIKINKNINGKVQVIGYDDKDREQRIYHSNWIEKAKKEKYRNMNNLSKKYSDFDNILDKYIRRKDLSKECVMSNMLKILMIFNIRIGSDIYFEENKTCGLCTLQKKNFKIIDNEYFLIFIGKKGIKHTKHVKNVKIKHFLEKMMKIKNDRLFCYVENNEIFPIISTDLNNFLKNNLGENFSAKDLRTYSANLLFKNYIKQFGKPHSISSIHKNIREAIKLTSEQLGNTPRVCKESYIDPKIINKYIIKYS